MNSTYLEQLEALLRSHANPVVAGPMQAYMKGHFPFLGIKTPERNLITNSFIKEHGIPHGDELEHCTSIMGTAGARISVHSNDAFGKAA